MSKDCSCDDNPGCVGVVIIVLIVLWLTGNCEGNKNRPAPDPHPTTPAKP